MGQHERHLFFYDPRHHTQKLFRGPGLNTLRQLRQWLLDADDIKITEFANRKKHILSLLTALSYDPDPVVSDRAITWTGTAAKIVNRRDPEYIRNYLLRLFWLVNDESGGIGWRAPELIGEIISSCPNFRYFMPMLSSLLDLEKEDAPRFREGTLKAIARVAQVQGEDTDGS